jgi:serine/threonine protein kinase
MIDVPPGMPARYRKVSKIADGGMAEIFLAVQHGAEGFERRVVLKQILAALLADPKFRNLLVDEALVAMSLNHSNIVQVLDLGQSKGRYFLVLELVDGWDLNRIISRMRGTQHPLAPELALYIVAEVCRALSYAHAQTRGGEPLCIVHRDVSPHNVLISEQGEVKLTDFGIAKALGRRERTGEGIIKGKLAFMSPEQASGSDLDARSDLFSVGTMLYLLVVGRRPFESPTDLETILRVQQCQFPPAREVKPDLPHAIADIVGRAMQRDPSDRYQTAEEMLSDLETAQRSVLRPAGQTELKRWLVSLAEKDHVLPTSRTPASVPDAQVEEGDLEEDIVFEEVATQASAAANARGPTSASVIRAADAFRFAPPPAGDTRADRVFPTPTGSESAYRVPSPLSFPTLPSRRRWLVGGLLGGAVLTAGALVAIRMRFGELGLLVDRWLGAGPSPGATTEPGGTPAGASGSAPPPATARPAEPTPAAPAPPPAPEAAPVTATGPSGGTSPGSEPAALSSPPPAAPAEPGATPEEEAKATATDPEAARPEEKASEAAPAGAEAAGEDGEDEEDEEALLKRQEPDIAEKVIGQEPETAAPPAPAPRRAAAEPPPARPAPAPAASAAARSPTPVRKPASREVAVREPARDKDPASVRIESKPDGAVIRLGSRVFGRAPMNLRFRPGVTYELTFVKQGYESTRKRFTASSRKGQRVTVALKKRSASSPSGSKRKGFFQRLLGGLKRQNR